MAQFTGGKVLPRETLDQFKFEVASELGIPLSKGYNGDLRTHDAGRIGGRIGGRIVKVMIRMAEEQLANGGSLE